MTAIFISHSSKDNESAAQMKVWLEEQGHTSLFLDFDHESGIAGGADWEQSLYQNIRKCQAMILLLSPNWFNSHWCFAEFIQTRQAGKAIFPVIISPCEVQGIVGSIQLIDLTRNADDGYRMLALGLKKRGLDPADVFDWNPSRPLYPGLEAFQEEDAAIFFGRSEEILNCLERLESMRRRGRGSAHFALFLGASGSGKSSLVRAGLIPRLKKTPSEWLPLTPFRPQDDPFDELALAFADSFRGFGEIRDWKEIRQSLKTSSQSERVDGKVLLDLVRDLGIAAKQRSATVVLTIDQAEELYGFSAADASLHFLQLIRAALEESNQQLMVIATMRSDFLGEFQTHPVLQDPNYDHKFLYKVVPVDQMPERNFSKIIQGPARLAGLNLEEGLVEAMVNDTGTRDALPLLAFTLRKLHEKCAGDGLLEIREYDDLGRLDGAIKTEAERILHEQPLSDQDLDILRSAFIPNMVRISSDGTYARRRAYIEEMPPGSLSLLKQFVDARLLISNLDREKRETLEVAHEALLRSWPQLTTWLNEDQDKLRLLEILRRATADWDAGEKSAEFLIHRDALLKRIVDLTTSNRFAIQKNSLEQQYLNACLEEQKKRDDDASKQQEKQARDAELIKTAQLKAEREAELAEANRLIAEAAKVSKDIPDLIVLLTAEAIIAAKSLDEIVASAEYTINNALDSSLNWGRVLCGHKTGIDKIQVNTDSRWLLTISNTGRNICLWDLNSPAPNASGQLISQQKTESAHAPFYHPMFSPDGRWLFLIHEGKPSVIWDMRNPDPESSERTLGGFKLYKEALGSLTFSPDGNWLALNKGRKETLLWDLNSSGPVINEQILSGDSQGAKSIVFSPDSRWLLVSSKDKTASLWNLSSVELRAKSWNLPLYNDHFGKGQWLNFNPGTSKIVFSPDSHWLLIGNNKNQFQLWDVSNSVPDSLVRYLPDQNKQDTSAHFSANGRWLITHTTLKRECSLWDLSKASEEKHENLQPHRVLNINVIKISQDGNWLLTKDLSKGAYIAWDLRVADLDSGSRTLTVDNVHSEFLFSRHSHWLLKRDIDTNTITLWDLTEDERAPVAIVLDASHGNIVSIAFSDDEKWLSAGLDDCIAKLWNLDTIATNTSPAILRFHRKAITSLAFSHDGKWLITASANGIARMWALQDETILEFAGRMVCRNLTIGEWHQYFPSQVYRKTFEEYSVGAGISDAPEDLKIHGAERFNKSWQRFTNS